MSKSLENKLFDSLVMALKPRLLPLGFHSRWWWWWGRGLKRRMENKHLPERKAEQHDCDTQHQTHVCGLRISACDSWRMLSGGEWMDVVWSGLGKQGFIYFGQAWPWNTLHCFHVEWTWWCWKGGGEWRKTPVNSIIRLQSSKDDKLKPAGGQMANMRKIREERQKKPLMKHACTCVLVL